MKKYLAGLILMIATSAAIAEPSFNDIQSLIEQHQYSAAESGLVEIIKNHPQSAKAYYTMAQAQAGLGNLEKARFALDRAQGLEPSLSFADSGAVRNLRQAISPQTSKIEAVPESNFWTYFFILVGIGLLYLAYRWYSENKEEGQTGTSGTSKPSPRTPSPSSTGSSTRTSSSTTSTRSTKWSSNVEQQPQVVNHYHNDNSGDLLTGVLLGEALANSSHSHETVIVQQAPSVTTDYFSPRVQPAPVVDSSWDDNYEYESSTVAPSKSSSWDSTPSKSSYTPSPSSSSWDDNSSSKSSSSWGSSSSSSSSSWDSGSSSSSSSWDSGSSSDSSSSWD
jgi:hypothetical protein